MVMGSSMRSMVVWLRDHPIVSLAIVLEIAIIIGALDRTVLIRTFFAQFILVLIWLVGGEILGARRAFLAICIWVALVASTTILDPAGPYVMQGLRAYRDLPYGAKLLTRLYTHAESARWQNVDRVAMRPYVYLSVRPLERTENILVKVNDGPPQSLIRGLEARRVSQGYAIPISWDEIEGTEFVNIALTFLHDSTTPLNLFIGPYTARGKWHRPQRLVLAGEKHLVPEYLNTQSNFVLEIRIADDKNRVAAVLY